MAIEKEVPIHGEVIMRLEEASFWYNENRPVLKETNMVVRKGAKLTLMGQNGAGKSTLFKLITGEASVTEGRIIIDKAAKIAIANQYIPHDLWEMTVRDYLQSAFKDKVYDIDPRAEKAFKTVELKSHDNSVNLLDKQIKDLSGGQKGRLLIARALIQNPDILLLDEPTNNLDKDGVKMLTSFMKDFPGTAIVISHDENFLNSFTHGIIYLNVQTNQIEQYVGNYFKALEEIKRKIEADERANAQLAREIQDNKDKVNFFAHKGGKMRKLAAKLRDEIEEMEDSKVEVRKDDRVIRDFKIKCSDELSGNILEFSSVELLTSSGRKDFKLDLNLRKGDKLQLIGPNGIGKTTLLEKIAQNKESGVKVVDGVKIGYYRQDFSTLDFNKSSYDELASIFKRLDDHHIRSMASGFLIYGKELSSPVGVLSEGQKALLMWCYLTLLEPGVLIIDEPTNHVNFRHLPKIAGAIKNYQGVVIIVSHVNDFIRQCGVTKTIDLGKLAAK